MRRSSKGGIKATYAWSLHIVSIALLPGGTIHKHATIKKMKNTSIT